MSYLQNLLVLIYSMNNNHNKRRYLVPAVALVLLAALAATLTVFWKYSPYKITSNLIGNPRIILSLKNVEVVGRSDGKKAWSFKAKQADVARGRYRTELTSISEGKLFDIDEKHVATVTAGKAVYDSSTENVEATDGVKVVSVQGYTAQAEQARWSSFMKQLFCPGTVKFTANGSELIGQNLVADIDDQEVTIEKAKMVVEISDISELDGIAGKEKNNDKIRKIKKY